MNEKHNSYDDWEKIYSEIGKAYVQQLVDELAEEDADVDFQSLDKWFSEFNRKNSDGKIKTRNRSRFNKVLRVASILIVLTMVGFAGLYSSVEAFREEINSLFIYVEEDYVLLEHKDVFEMGEEDVYLLTYIPTEYILQYVKHNNDIIIMHYESENGSFINLTQTQKKLKTLIETKDSEIVHLSINGEAGIVVSNGDVNTLYWSNKSKNFTIESDLNQETLMKVASSIYEIK